MWRKIHDLILNCFFYLLACLRCQRCASLLKSAGDFLPYQPCGMAGDQRILLLLLLLLLRLMVLLLLLLLLLFIAWQAYGMCCFQEQLSLKFLDKAQKYSFIWNCKVLTFASISHRWKLECLDSFSRFFISYFVPAMLLLRDGDRMHRSKKNTLPWTWVVCIWRSLDWFVWQAKGTRRKVNLTGQWMTPRHWKMTPRHWKLQRSSKQRLRRIRWVRIGRRIRVTIPGRRSVERRTVGHVTGLKVQSSNSLTEVESTIVILTLEIQGYM